MAEATSPHRRGVIAFALDDKGKRVLERMAVVTGGGRGLLRCFALDPVAPSEKAMHVLAGTAKWLPWHTERTPGSLAECLEGAVEQTLDSRKWTSPGQRLDLVDMVVVAPRSARVNTPVPKAALSAVSRIRRRFLLVKRAILVVQPRYTDVRLCGAGTLDALPPLGYGTKADPGPSFDLVALFDSLTAEGYSINAESDHTEGMARALVALTLSAYSTELQRRVAGVAAQSEPRGRYVALAVSELDLSKNHVSHMLAETLLHRMCGQATARSSASVGAGPAAGADEAEAMVVRAISERSSLFGGQPQGATFETWLKERFLQSGYDLEELKRILVAAGDACTRVERRDRCATALLMATRMAPAYALEQSGLKETKTDDPAPKQSNKRRKVRNTTIWFGAILALAAVTNGAAVEFGPRLGVPLDIGIATANVAAIVVVGLLATLKSLLRRKPHSEPKAKEQAEPSPSKENECLRWRSARAVELHTTLAHRADNLKANVDRLRERVIGTETEFSRVTLPMDVWETVLRARHIEPEDTLSAYWQNQKDPVSVASGGVPGTLLASLRSFARARCQKGELFTVFDIPGFLSGQDGNPSGSFRDVLELMRIRALPWIPVEGERAFTIVVVPSELEENAIQVLKKVFAQDTILRCADTVGITVFRWTQGFSEISNVPSDIEVPL